MTPSSIQELMIRARALAGYSLSELATHYSISIPQSSTQAKGWIGQLLEALLETTAGCEAKPDFVELDIELKTLPINEIGRPLESTYVCTVPLKHNTSMSWHDSVVYQKLKHVLWVPIIGNKKTPLSNKLIGTPILWAPSTEQAKILEDDWNELSENILYGDIDKINAQQGTYLHIRPKAANSKSLTSSYNQWGEKILTLPRGFYLRTSLTCQITCSEPLLKCGSKHDRDNISC